ncbi:MAG: RNA polymerase sporulation sigma factor SigE [Oscillospiraceae bacterium]|nr:RNA polymerase sporulation sigma factor SigE [Oscillospiraceae bacterium]
MTAIFSSRSLQQKLAKLMQALHHPTALHYIHGPQTLPAPLSKQQELQAFDGIRRGEQNARNTLISHDLRLVVYIAKKFENTGVGLEDLISIGSIGLIKAVNTFDPDKNIKLATYASRCIENEILMFLRRAQNKHQDLSIDEPLNTDWDGNELLLSDILGTEGDVVSGGIEQQAEAEVLRSIVAAMPQREREIIEIRFGLFGKKPHTQKEVADLIGISQSYISRLEKRIIASLREQLVKMI